MFLNSQKLCSFFLFAFLLMYVPTTMQASHIVGGDISYRCLGDNEYEITLTVRRDCENGADDAPFDDPAIIGIFDIFGSLQTSLGNLGRIEVPFTGEDTITNALIFDCGAVGDPVCVHESVYKTVVTLPFNKIGYCIAYQRCCRNSLLNNIQNPLETGATYWTCITTEAMNTCNNQPTFNSWPDVYICAGEGFTFDHSATDVDGDELVYRLCTPSLGGTIDNPQPSVPSNPPYTDVVWQAPYSLNNVLGGTPLRIDAQTGVITAEPGTVGTFLVGICVDEYRNGELISTVRRDFEYNVRICTNPIIADFEVEDNDCDGDLSMSFNNTTEGADSYQWYFDYPDNTLTSTEENPSITYPESGKYTVRMEATRDADGCTTSVEKVVSTSTTLLDADFTVGFESCDDGNLIRLTDQSVDPTGQSCAVEWNWTIRTDNGVISAEGNPAVIDIGSAGNVEIELEVVSSSGCVSNISKTIDTSDLFSLGDFESKLLSCTVDGFLIELINTSSSTSTISEPRWVIEQGGNTTNLSGESVQIDVSGGDLRVEMTIETDGDCDIQVDRIVELSDFLPELVIVNDLGGDCPEVSSATITFSGELQGGNMMANPTSYVWTVDGVSSSGPEVMVDMEDGDSVDLTLTVTYDNGCTLVAMDQRYTADYTPDVTVQEDLDCDGDRVRLILSNPSISSNSNATAVTYNWTVDGQSSNNNSVTIDLSDERDVEVRLEVEFDNGCVGVLDKIYNINDDDLLPINIVEDTSCEGDRIDVTLTNEANSSVSIVSQTWTVDGQSSTDASVMFSVTGDESVTVTLSVEYSNGCSRTVTRIYNRNNLIPKPQIDVDALCNGDRISVTLSGSSPSNAIDIVSQVWTVDGVTSTDSSVSFTVDGDERVNVTLSVVYDNGCESSTSETYSRDNLIPKPIIDVDVICDGDDRDVTLTATTDGTVNIVSQEWTVDGVTSTDPSVMISIAGSQTVDVELNVEYDNGCMSSTSMTYDADNVIPDPVIVADTECNGDRVDVTLTNEEDGVDIISRMWTVNGRTSTGRRVSFSINGDETAVVTLTVEYANGCSKTVTRTYNINDDSLLPINITEDTSCEGDRIDVTLTNEPTGNVDIVSQVWTINGQTSTASSVMFSLEGDESVEVSLTVDFSNGCSRTITRLYNRDNLIPRPEIEASSICRGDRIDVTLSGSSTNSNLGIVSQVWTVDGVTSTDRNATFSITGDESVDVTLSVVYSNGCESSNSETYNRDNLIPEPIIEVDVLCDGDDRDVTLTASTDGTVSIVSQVWSVYGVTSTDPSVMFSISGNETVDVELSVEYDNGCSSSTSMTYDADNVIPDPIITADTRCSGDRIDVVLTNEEAGVGIISRTWTVDGRSSNGRSVSFSIDGDESVEVTLSVEYANGCSKTITRTYDRDELIPVPEVEEESQCNGDMIAVQLTHIDDGLDVDRRLWTIDGQTFTSRDVEFNIDGDQRVDVTLEVQYSNGCSNTFSRTYDKDYFTPRPDFDVEFVECDDDGVIITLSSPGDQRTSSWTVVDDNGSSTYGRNPSTIVVNGSEIEVTLDVEYDNGCTASSTRTIDIDELSGGGNVTGDPEIDYTVELVECYDSTGLFRLEAIVTNISPCVNFDINDVSWVINGETYTRSPLTVELPLGEEVDINLIITLSDGRVISIADDGINNDIINTGDYFTQVPIEVEDKVDIRCDDTLNVCVVNPDPNLIYEWSLDPDFGSILGSGVTLETNGGADYDGRIYTRAIDPNDPCVKGFVETILESDAIELGYDRPIIICPGDTSEFVIENLNADQTITSWQWKDDSGNLISGGDTNMPVIGVSEDQTDDFFMVLCTTNDKGCTGVDTIRFGISAPTPLQQFQSTVDSCGSLTVNFDISPNLLEGPYIWDFGDGTEVSNSAMPVHTYDMPGVYPVTLFDFNSVCPQDPITVDIFVGDMVVSVEADTVRYDNEGSPIVSAETNYIDSLMRWCTLEGDSIYTGNPLEGFDPPTDTFEVVVKVEDIFGCSDQDTVVLIRDTDNTSECLDSVTIIGPDLGMVCIGDTFSVCVNMPEDCDLEDFTFLWEENDCIVDGQGTAKIRAVTDSDKSFSVLITSNTTGQDSIYTYDVMVSNPAVSITVDPININPEGQPFVCLGQSIVLTAEGDPDCDYIWSNGETGQTIEVMPEEQTSYTVTCINDIGCETTSQVFVLNVEPPQCNENDVFLPNAFSPNGDDVNDILLVRSKFIRDMELLIQNRWGEEVFVSTDQNIGWDGTFKGKELAPDVYSYCLKVTCINDTEYVKVGNVSLIK